jgi:hypothetical protein
MAETEESEEDLSERELVLERLTSINPTSALVTVTA